MSNYFINKLCNKMGLTKEQLEAKLNAVDTTEKEVETPQGIEAETIETSENDAVSENDTQETPEVTDEVVVETTDEVTDEIVTDEATNEETEQVTDEVVDEPQQEADAEPVVDPELQNALAKIQELENKLQELETLQNTPVVNNKIAKSTDAPAQKSSKELTKDFMANVWSAKI